MTDLPSAAEATHSNTKAIDKDMEAKPLPPALTEDIIQELARKLKCTKIIVHPDISNMIDENTKMWMKTPKKDQKKLKYYVQAKTGQLKRCFYDPSAGLFYRVTGDLEVIVYLSDNHMHQFSDKPVQHETYTQESWKAAVKENLTGRHAPRKHYIRMPRPGRALRS